VHELRAAEGAKHGYGLIMLQQAPNYSFSSFITAITSLI
jgi:hypothetical protein